MRGKRVRSRAGARSTSTDATAAQEIARLRAQLVAAKVLADKEAEARRALERFHVAHAQFEDVHQEVEDIETQLDQVG